MDVLELKAVQDFIRCCTDGWDQGWHERNAGNLTYRLLDHEADQIKDQFCKDQTWHALGVQASNLAGSYFITTGSGKYFRNVELDPEHSIGIVELNDKGDAWRLLWGLKDGGKPTSEFPSHILNHSVRLDVTQGKNRVIYHAHTPSLIAMTFILPLNSKAFSKALWKSATECIVVFPDGVGVVPWMVPGGSDIAISTSQEMKHHQAVIWAHHGLFCSGESFDEAFGLMHTIEKSADIYMKVISSGKDILQVITDDDLLAIAEDFDVDINKEYFES